MKKFIQYIIIVGSLGLMAGCQTEEKTYPQRKDLIDAVFAYGYVMTEDEYVVTAKTEGYLDRVFVEEGDVVEKGMPLFLLSNEVPSAQLTNAQVKYADALERATDQSPEIQQLKAQIDQGKLQRDNDKRQFDRYANLLNTGAVSQSDYDRAKFQYESAEKNIEMLEQSLADLKKSRQLSLKNAETELKVQQNTNQDYILSSIIQGTVLQVFKKEGELVKKGESVAQIGGGSPIVKLYIAEEDISYVTTDQKVIITLNTDQSKAYWAKIHKIYPAFNLTEQSFEVEAVFDELPKVLFTNTQAQANIIIDKKKNVLVVPNTYLTPENEVLLTDGSLVPVEIGLQNEYWTEIIKGIDESQLLVLPTTDKDEK